MESLSGLHPFVMGEGGEVRLDILEKLGSDVVAFLSDEQDAVHVQLWPAGELERVVQEYRVAGAAPPAETVRLTALPNGALKLPEEMLEAAGMPAGTECEALGVHDHVELWNAQCLEGYFDSGVNLSLLF